ncbi:RNA-binding ATPase activator esf2 [Loxospora ochrophaea]|nr:RNA-binding ATPase activator esf2 [Loxospora ochrophaea]
MSVRKHNEYLDAASDGEDEDSSHVSEIEDDGIATKTTKLSNRASKKRKINHSDASAINSEDEASSQEDRMPVSQPASPSSPVTTAPPKPTKKPPSTKQPAKPTKTGVIYLSRIPPFMRPPTLRHLLTPYGTITNLFLTPEPPSAYTHRLKSGGNKKHSYIDGWVEFSRRRDAKAAVELLNGHVMGGKKGGWYHDDVWCMRYLKGFSWEDLMRGVREEEGVREARLRAEREKVGRERRAFLRGVEEGKMEGRRRGKREKRGGGEEAGAASEGVGRKGVERLFRQNEVMASGGKRERGKGQQPEDVRRVLAKIF